MDKIYEAYNANATEKIHILNYFENYRKLLTPPEYSNLNKIFFNNEQLENLTEICSINKLDCDDEISSSSPYNEKDAAEKLSQIPENTDLETLKRLKTKYRKECSRKAGEYLKYQKETPITYEPSTSMSTSATPGTDIFITIRIYQPFKWEKPRSQRISLSKVIIMLGNQTLDQLRDKIYCLSDLTGAYDSSENPEKAKNIPANRDVYKSGFFFIEDTFYNDTRDENNKDNSAVIRTWGESRGFGPFKIEKMENIRLDSLTVRFGYPWVYQHQGTCEHLIVFSDARLADVDDDLDVSNYPKIERIRHFRCSVCMMCNLRPLHWLVCESDRIPHDPCYFCKQCFQSFNYIDGKKIGNFKAYRYPYDPDIVETYEDALIKCEDN